MTAPNEPAWLTGTQTLHTSWSDPSIQSQLGQVLAQNAALRAALVSPLPTVGSLTYNGDGTIASDSDGNTYTWNSDGTPATQTKGGVTRTYHWNTDGTLASVS